jgi:hypothetical protein
MEEFCRAGLCGYLIKIADENQKEIFIPPKIVPRFLYTSIVL